MTSEDFVYLTLIAATPETVWTALTTPEFTRQYWHATRVESTWTPGDEVVFWVDSEAGPHVGCEGKVLKADKPHCLSYTWRFASDSEISDDEYSRVTFTLESVSGYTRLTVIHDRFPEKSKTRPAVTHGWPHVIAGLKTLLETGSAVDFSELAA